MLFARVKYALPPSLPLDTKDKVKHLLDNNGATQVSSLADATHIITNTRNFEGWRTLKNNAVVVPPIWVQRSMVLGKLQPTESYSLDPEMIFSGIVASAADLTQDDTESLRASLLALGGQWRNSLTKEVTHLFALSKDSDKYKTAMHFKNDISIKILLPHWFDDAVKCHAVGYDTTPYEWPDTPFFANALRSNQASSLKSHKKLDSDKKVLMHIATKSDVEVLQLPEPKNIWDYRQILLSTTLGLEASRIATITAAIKQSGGVVIQYETNDGRGTADEEFALVPTCDVYICRHRSGRAYFQACRLQKTVGNLTWLSHVHQTGVVTAPMDQLLHYPIPKKSIERFQKEKITITNYSGEAREYLKKVITLLGATFTPNMSNDNTILIAAHKENGLKIQRAEHWNMTIVNHLWLEDCVAEWRFVGPTNDRYTYFPPGVNWVNSIATKSVKRSLEDPEYLDEAELEDCTQAENYVPPPGTENSARDANEVAELFGVDEHLDDMDLDFPSDPLQTPLRKTPKKKIPQSEPSAKKRSRRTAQTQIAETIADEVEIGEPPRPSRPRLLRPSSQHISNESDVEQKNLDVTGDGVLERPALIPSPPKALVRHKEASGYPERNEESAESPPSAKRVTRASKSTPPSVPRPGVAILMPGLKLTHQEEVLVSPHRGLTRTHSIQAAASERARADGTLSLTKPKSSPPKTTESSGRSKRTAAAKASQRLHEEVMPDVVNYQQEMIRNKKRKSGGAASFSSAVSSRKPSVDNDSDHQGKSRGWNKTTDAEDRPLKRRRISSNWDPDDSEDVDRGHRESTISVEEKRSLKTSRKTINLVLTKVDLAPKVLDALARLGAKITDQYHNCTHLLAPSIIRTEKLLCSLPNDPWILTGQWAIDSAAAKTLLPEEDYLLHDSEGEDRYSFKLADSLKRAKRAKTGTKIFEGKTFYMTPKTDPKMQDTLRKVVAANGGIVSSSQANQRNLDAKPNRYVISCPQDSQIWKALRGHKIYSTELVLTGALQQQVDWDNEGLMVVGSF